MINEGKRLIKYRFVKVKKINKKFTTNWIIHWLKKWVRLSIVMRTFFYQLNF